MTALKEFARLESGGLWRAAPDAQRRAVTVSFGKATLVLSDSSGRAVTHWSLAAVQRLNPGVTPALYSPDGTDDETLEIEEEDMANAIDHVQRSIARARPRPGRLRWLLLTGSFALVGYLCLWWLPDALVRHAVAVVPEVKRDQIGADLQSRIIRLSGQPCRDPFATVALRKFKDRVLPGHDGDLTVLPDGLDTTRVLPGGAMLIARKLIEDHDDPAVLAGFTIAAHTGAQAHDPLERMLNATGTWTAIQLLTSGQVAPGALDAYAKAVLVRAEPPADTDTLIDAFAAAHVPTRPYALAQDVTGETTLDLIEADPFHGVSTRPLITDGEWLALQGICETE